MQSCACPRKRCVLRPWSVWLESLQSSKSHVRVFLRDLEAAARVVVSASNPHLLERSMVWPTSRSVPYLYLLALRSRSDRHPRARRTNASVIGGSAQFDSLAQSSTLVRMPVNLP
jgi:hypothetical protein